MWADVERFGIDDLVAADHSGEGGGPRRTFTVQIPELDSIGVHWHDYYELGCVLEGRARHVVNGVAGGLEPGAVFLLSPADLHALEPCGDEPLRIVNAVLHPVLVERTLGSVLGADEPALPWLAADLPEAADDVAQICREVSARRAGWGVLVESSLQGVMVKLARCAERHAARAGDGAGTAPTHLRRALRYVERHFREPLTLAEVAAVAHLSPNWFSEQFRRSTGHSFQSHLKRRRLLFARALLESTELRVTEVCHAAGFSDASYFGRA